MFIQKSMVFFRKKFVGLENKSILIIINHPPSSLEILVQYKIFSKSISPLLINYFFLNISKLLPLFDQIQRLGIYGITDLYIRRRLKKVTSVLKLAQKSDFCSDIY